jgi:hypothetical protein
MDCFLGEQLKEHVYIPSQDYVTDIMARLQEAVTADDASI